MIKQNNKDCLPIIQKIGCFVRSCGAIAELATGKELTVKQINELWNWSKKSGHINIDNCVKHSAPIATKALKMLGNEKGQFLEIATFKNGKLGFYGGISPMTKARPRFYIQKIKTNGNEGTHFRVVNGQGDLLFDPYYPDVKPMSIFYSIVYAYRED